MEWNKMRLKTHKMDANLYNQLKNINQHVDEAVRELMKALYSEANVLFASNQIDAYNKQLAENNTEIENIPKKKEEEKQRILEASTEELERIKIKKKALHLQIKHPRVINVSREYEKQPEWIELETNDYKLALKKVEQNEKNLLDQIAKIDDTFKGENEFDSHKKNLEDQNKRILMEIDRAKRILEVQKLVDGNVPKTTK